MRYRVIVCLCYFDKQQMCYVMFSCCQLYKIIFIVSSTHASRNFMMSLEIFSIREHMVLLDESIIYTLIVHVLPFC